MQLIHYLFLLKRGQESSYAEGEHPLLVLVQRSNPLVLHAASLNQCCIWLYGDLSPSAKLDASFPSHFKHVPGGFPPLSFPLESPPLCAVLSLVTQC